jgi:hypothetical protein
MATPEEDNICQAAVISGKGERMLKKISYLILVCSCCVSISGCALIPIALSAAGAYGVYKAIKH